MILTYIEKFSSIIISIAGVAGAILGIQKFIDTYTEKGKKRKEAKQSKWDERIAKIAKETSDQTAERVMTDFYNRQDETIGEIFYRLEDMGGRLEEVETMNRTQNELFKLTNQKIDQNEIDRIRHEILYFAGQCRKKAEFSFDDFHHIMDIHRKYEELLQANNLTNGQMDIDYGYIIEYYNQLSRDGKL